MSFKLVDKVKKSCLPGQLKAVLEAYLSFGNKDGTSIRPTAAKVAKRAGRSQRTVERYAPVLVKLGLLVHDRDEGGNYLIHNYPRAGVWAYVYHADLSSLDNPQVIAGFEFDKAILSEKRRAAAKSRSPRQLALFDSGKMAGTPTDNLSETIPANLSETPTDKLADRPDPKATLRSADHTKEDPSAVSTAVSKKESKQVSPSFAALTTAPPAVPSLREEEQKQNQPLLGLECNGEEANQDQKQPQKQPQPQTLQELVDSDQFMTPPVELLYRISPNVTDAMVKEQLPLCARILGFFEDADDYKVQAATLVLKFNRAHRQGKYATKDDKKLYIRTAAQYLKALESDSATLMNDYASHNFRSCEVCQEAEVFDYKAFVREVRRQKEREAEQARQEKKAAAERAKRKAEEDRIARLCPECRKNEPGKHLALRGGGGGWVKVCDPCYDRKYEYQQQQIKQGFRLPPLGILEPRPEYAEAKRKAEAEAIAKKMEDAECEVPICLECGQVTYHARTCSKNPNRNHGSMEAQMAANI